MSVIASHETNEPHEDFSPNQPELPTASDIAINGSVPPKKVGKPILVLSVLFIIGLAAMAVLFRDQLRDFEEYGYLGAFVISILSGGTIIVYVPGVPVVFTLGGLVSFPFLVGIAAGAGEALGAFTFYLAGRGGQSLLTEKQKSNRVYSKVEGWMTRHGFLTLFLASAIYNPVFSVIAATAGAIRYPVWKFYLSCAMGKIVKATYTAYLGAWGLGYILEWFHISLD
jgi:membrane protein DedA with SNARE-associated domain